MESGNKPEAASKAADDQWVFPLKNNLSEEGRARLIAQFRDKIQVDKKRRLEKQIVRRAERSIRNEQKKKELEANKDAKVWISDDTCETSEDDFIVDLKEDEPDITQEKLDEKLAERKVKKAEEDKQNQLQFDKDLLEKVKLKFTYEQLIDGLK